MILRVVLCTLGFTCGCGPPPQPLSVQHLCDGTTASELRVQEGEGGGNRVQPGAQVLYQNGFDFLVIDGECHFWVQTKIWDFVHIGTFEHADLPVLEERLGLAGWPPLAGTYSTGECDQPTRVYRLGGSTILAYGGCGHDTFGPARVVQEAVQRSLQFIRDKGTPSDGPLRFVLVRYEAPWLPTDLEFRNAPIWPLAASASELSISERQASVFRPADTHVVVGGEAASLRELWTRFRAGQIGYWDQIADSGELVPVKDADGKLYALFLRDVIPLEDPQGAWSAR